MVTNRIELEIKPVIVFDFDRQVKALASMNSKAFGKSLENDELWVLNDSGKILPFENTYGLTVRVCSTEKWYEAHITNKTIESYPGNTKMTGVDSKSILHRLEHRIRQRQRTHSKDSYTKYLFREGTTKIRKKLGEEAIELITTTPLKIPNEAADLLYHLLVFLVDQGSSLDKVLEVLSSREK